MKECKAITTNKKSVFWISSFIIIVSGILFLFFQHSNSRLNILPILIEIDSHKKPLRSPDTFSEDSTSNASKGKLSFNNKSSFSFKYTKSEREGHAFTGCFFPLEDVGLDFSEY